MTSLATNSRKAEKSIEILRLKPQDDKNAIFPYSQTSLPRKFCPNGNTPLLTSPIKGRKCAFTLAETLITLVIIGVVVALTVPTMITKYQKEQTVTRLKKAYSALAQTTARAIADYGPIDTWELGTHATPEAATEFAKKYLIPYLSVMKNCENNISGECAITRNVRNSSGGITGSDFNEKYSRFILNDGTLIGVYIYNNETYGKRALIYIDINGQKKPNLEGKDFFELSYNLVTPNYPTLQGKFLPVAIDRDRESIKDNDCKQNSAGYHCLALIMKDGWKISDDYPW